MGKISAKIFGNQTEAGRRASEEKLAVYKSVQNCAGQDLVEIGARDALDYDHVALVFVVVLELVVGLLAVAIVDTDDSVVVVFNVVNKIAIGLWLLWLLRLVSAGRNSQLVRSAEALCVEAWGCVLAAFVRVGANVGTANEGGGLG